MSQSPVDDFSQESVNRYRQGWQALNRLLHENRSFSGGERHCAFLNTGSSAFANISSVSGLDFAEDGRALGSVDWDFDGDLDLWITNRTAPRVRLMLNQSTSTNAFLALMLEGDGKKTNRDAINARVEVLGLSKPCIQTKHAGEGFLSQTSGWLHFGLGQHTAPVDVLVHWPNAAPERFKGLHPKAFYLLRQGSGQAQAWSPPQNGAAFAADDRPIRIPESPAEVRIVLPSGLPLTTLTASQPNGTETELTLKPEPTLLNVWATWCQPCLTELSAWSAQADAFRKAGLQVLTLNADEDTASRKKSSAILKQLGSPFPAAVATSQTIRRLDVLQRSTLDVWESLPVPSSFLVDSQGYVRIIYKGGVSAEQVLADLKLLQATPAALRDAAIPFPGKWSHDPTTFDPLRVTTQFVDHDLVPDGLAYLQKSIQLDQKHRASQFSKQDFADRYFVVATLQQTLGQAAAAEKTYQQVLALNPTDQRARRDLMKLYEEQGQTSKAIAEMQELLKETPNDVTLASRLAILLVRSGQVKPALPLLDKLVQTANATAEWHFYHGVALQRSGDFAKAVLSFDKAHQIDPQHALTNNSLAWIGSTHPDGKYRNGKRAEVLATQLCERTQYRNPSFLMTLAAAQAELGQFPKAAATIQKAIAVLKAAKPTPINDIKVLETRLALYQASKHFRDKSL